MTRLWRVALKAALVTAFSASVSCGFAARMVVPGPPSIAAGSYILMDFHSGVVIAEKKADEAADPASITKLMTAYLVYEALAEGTIRIDDQVEVSEHAWKTGGSRMFIDVGSQVSVKDLLIGIVVQSGNDASVALAEHVAGSESAFVDMMNEKAVALGMTGSRFVNSTGLPDPEHYMTARDIATLSRILIRDFPGHYAMYSVKEFTYNNISQRNRNRLLWRDPSVDGLKTGYTEAAGYCLAASAMHNGMRLVSVILRSDSGKRRSTQTAQLLDYGFRFFKTHRLYQAMQPMLEVRVWGGELGQLQLGVPEDFYVTVPRGAQKKIEIESHVVEEINAPVSRMQSLGMVKVSFEDWFSRETALVALTDVPRGDILTRMVDGFLKLF